MDLAPQVGQLGLDVDHRRMPLAIVLRQLGDAPFDHAFLFAQPLDQRRIQYLAGAGHAAGGQQGLHLAQARLDLDALGALHDELGAQLGDLLLGQGRVLALDQALLGAEGFDRVLRQVNLLAELGDPFGQPVVGPLGRLELRVELGHDVEIGQRVGHLRGGARPLRIEGDADHPRAAFRLDGELLEEGVDQPRLQAGRLLGLREHDRLFLRRLLEDGSAPALRQIVEVAAPIEQPVEGTGESQARVELGIAIELQLGNGLLGQLARADDLDLAFDRLGVSRQAGEHGLHVDDPGFPRLDHHVGGGRVARRDVPDEQRRDDDDHGGGQSDNALAAPKRANDLANVDLVDLAQNGGAGTLFLPLRRSDLALRAR